MIIRYLYWEQLLQVMNEMTMLFFIFLIFFNKKKVGQLQQLIPVIQPESSVTN